MDVAQLILDYIKALVWPLVVVVLLVILRREIRALASRLTGAELPGVKLAFENQVLKARVEAEESQAVLDTMTSETEKPADDTSAEESALESVTEDQSSTSIGRPPPPVSHVTSDVAESTVEAMHAWDSFMRDISEFTRKELNLAVTGQPSPPTVRMVAYRIGLPPSWADSTERVQNLIFDVELGRQVPTRDIANELLTTTQLLRGQLRKAQVTYAMKKELEERSRSTHQDSGQ